MEGTKTLDLRSLQEQLPSAVEWTLLKERSLHHDSKSLVKTMEQKINRILSRYLPKDVVDIQETSTGQLIKCLLKEKTAQYFILEKILRHLWCDVTISKLTKEELDELEMLLDAWSGIVWI